MKIVRISLAGLAAAIFDSIFAVLTCGWLFRWVYEIEPANVWKPMDSPPGPIVYIGWLVFSIVFALVYVVLSKGIPGQNRPVKGLVFGLCVWAVGMLPGMLAMYSFMNIAVAVVIYWTATGLIRTPLKGLIVALICEGKPGRSAD